jgi:predicted aspartyl protease
MEVGLGGQSQASSRRPQAIKINETWANNEGLFVKAKLQNKCLAFLIDTGANVTILSKQFIENIQPSLLSQVNPVNVHLVTATGETSPFIGQINVQISLGKKFYQHNVFIADISNEGILGMDFLAANNCDVHLSENSLCLKGESIPLFHYASNAKSCCRISIRETTYVPPNTEIIAKGQLMDLISKDLVGLVEHTDKFVNKKGLLLARAIINLNKEEIPLRIVNVNDTPCTIYKGTIVATCELIKETDIQENKDVNMSNVQHDVKKVATLPSHIENVYERGITCLDENQQKSYKDLLVEFQTIFSKSEDDIGLTNLVEHTINTGDHRPVRQRPRRIPLAKIKEAEEAIQNMVKQEVIEQSMSPWNSNPVLVRKSDGSLRFCIDFRGVNDITVKDSHPLPRIDDTIDALSGAKYFSTADLKSGYYQIPVAEKDRHKTAFSFPGGGLWQFKRMPMGLSNSAPVFERLMERVLSGLTWKTCLVYLDDIIIFSRTFENHLANLREVFERLKEAHLKLSPKKCHFFKTKVKFLGHIVSDEGVSTDPSKIKAVKDWPIPRNVKEVRSFLGLTSYYRKFIYKYADKAKALHKITEKNQKFTWTEDCQKSFDALKQALISAPILAYPTREDFFILDTDASNVGMGSVLSQVQDGQEKVISYYSKSFNKAERKYCVTRRELLAVVASIKNFHHYLYGRKFKVRSDHGALSWLFNFKNPEGQLARWFEVLASYDFRIEHRAGRSHNNADALSRRPCQETCCPYCLRAERNYDNQLSETKVSAENIRIDPNKSPEENCLNCLDKSVDDSNDLEINTVQVCFGQNDIGPNNENNSKCIPCLICDSCQLVQEVQHERSIKGSSQKGENIRKSLKQNIGIRKSYSGKHDIPCNLETEGKSVVLPKLLEHVRVSTRAKSYDETMQDKDNIKTLQQNDEILSQIFLWKSNNKKPTWSDISHTSPEIKFYWSRLNSFIIKDEILYRKWESNDGKNYDLHLVIPKSLNGFVLNQVHNTLTGGHLGVRKTLYKIKKRYFWYQIRNDVKNWCSKCDTCAMKKAPHRKPKCVNTWWVLLGREWQLIYWDLFLGQITVINT